MIFFYINVKIIIFRLKKILKYSLCFLWIIYFVIQIFFVRYYFYLRDYFIFLNKNYVAWHYKIYNKVKYREIVKVYWSPMMIQHNIIIFWVIIHMFCTYIYTVLFVMFISIFCVYYICFVQCEFLNKLQPALQINKHKY